MYLPTLGYLGPPCFWVFDVNSSVSRVKKVLRTFQVNFLRRKPVFPIITSVHFCCCTERGNHKCERERRSKYQTLTSSVRSRPCFASRQIAQQQPWIVNQSQWPTSPCTKHCLPICPPHPARTIHLLCILRIFVHTCCLRRRHVTHQIHAENKAGDVKTAWSSGICRGLWHMHRAAYGDLFSGREHQ